MPPLVSRFLHKLRNLLLRRHAETDLEREVQSHLDLLEDHFEQTGLTQAEARFAAKRAYGSIEAAKEQQRDARTWVVLERCVQDARFAFRSLRKNPGFSAVAILTLALGIGANSAIFSVLDFILLRPLPYPKSAEIVAMNLRWKDGSTNSTLGVPQFEFLRDHGATFSSVAGVRGAATVALKRANAPDWIRALIATDGLFEVLGVRPALGRAFERNDTRPGNPRVAILGDALWRNAFDSDPDIIGRQIQLDDSAYAVVGVMPRDFRFVEAPADLIVALQLGNGIADTGLNTRVLARLRPGVAMSQAQAYVDTQFGSLRAEGRVPSGQHGVQLESYRKWLAGDLRISVLILFGAVCLFLLIACANVASLLMARAFAREREISIRLAIGSGRSHLIQQFLIESLILASAGTAAGLLLASATLRALLPAIPWDHAALASIGVDARILAFALILAVVTTLLFGFASYWQVSKFDPNRSLKESGSAGSQQAAHNRARSFLVVGQLAVSVTLLVGAGLLVMTLYRLHRQELGFDPHRVYAATTPFERKANLKPSQLWDFEQRVLQRIRAIPGVRSAAVVSTLPLSGPDNLPTQHEGHPEHSIGGMEYRAISPEYFQTMQIRLVAGRVFKDSDAASSLPVAMIGETVARRWWPEGSPIGDRLIVGQFQGRQFPEVLEQPRQIVGVVADVKNLAVDEGDPATVYVPAAQLPTAPNSTAWVVRANGNAPLAPALRRAILAVNPDQRILDIEPMTAVVARSIARPTFNASLMMAFGALALLLTAVGIYGLLSFQVACRDREIGIRIALGAKRSQVAWMILKEAAILALAGIALGGLGAFLAARFMANSIPNLTSNDPLVYISAGALLFFVALMASYLPARRASAVDPAQSLRSA